MSISRFPVDRCSVWSASSGSGKTTLGRLLVRLLQPTSGGIQFDGVEIGHLGEAELRPLRARIQMIFQDPQSSLNPRLRLAVALTRPLQVFGRLKGRRDQRDRAAELLDLVGLPPHFIDRYPHELSGGRRQRAGIARALASSLTSLSPTRLFPGSMSRPRPTFCC